MLGRALRALSDTERRRRRAEWEHAARIDTMLFYALLGVLAAASVALLLPSVL